MNSIVITGTSTGIGYDAARYLIERGWRVFGSVRKAADGERVRATLGERYVPLLFDVTDEAGIATAAIQVATAVGNDGLQGLVNNAGVAVPGPLMHVPLDEARRQFEINVVGQLAVTQAFLPLLGARPQPVQQPGRIVNISSVSGQIAYPFLGLYAGSKHALEAMSDSLRRELMIYGIDVIVIEPGSVATPIWDKVEQTDQQPFSGTDFEPMLRRLQMASVRQGRGGIPVERVSEVIYTALTARRPKTRYALPRQRWIGWFIPRFLPDRWVDRLVAGRVGLRRID